MGFGFLTGNSIGPLLDLVISIEPQVVVTALIGTAVVFISLSCSALLAERGSFLFLGGIFMSILSTMTLFGLANIFIQSQILYQVLQIVNRLSFVLGSIISFVLGSFICWSRRDGWFRAIRYSNDHGKTPSWFNRLHQTFNGPVL